MFSLQRFASFAGISRLWCDPRTEGSLPGKLAFYPREDAFWIILPDAISVGTV